MSEVFDVLNAVNVNDRTERKKTGNVELTYLSWAWAWAEVKKRYPEAHYEIEKTDGLPYVFDPLTGYMVYTTVTIEGVTHEMWLPVMDGANKAMKAEPYTYLVKDPGFRYSKPDADGIYRDKYGNPHTEYIEKVCEAATMFDVNKTIMRCLVKNLAMFGLGLYIYAGEDLPEGEPMEAPKTVKQNVKAHSGTRIADDEVEMLTNLLAQTGKPDQYEKSLLKHYKVSELDELTADQYLDARVQIEEYLSKVKKDD